MSDGRLREHLLELVRGEGAHLRWEDAVRDLSPELRGARPAHIPHSPWRLLEHVRIAQWDILEFCHRADHESPSFPEGYWPDGDAPPDDEAWDTSLAHFFADRKAIEQMVADPSVDLLAPIPHSPDKTLLREVLLVADHNAYHVGQLVILRRALGAWPED